MFVVLIKLLLPAIILFFVFHKIFGKKDANSKSFLALLLTSILFNIALAQNYHFSIIPYEGRDGFSVSNWLAYYIFGEDHFGYWNTEIFKAGYDISLLVTFVLLVAYLVSLVIERKKDEVVL